MHTIFSNRGLSSTAYGTYQELMQLIGHLKTFGLVQGIFVCHIQRAINALG